MYDRNSKHTFCIFCVKIPRKIVFGNLSIIAHLVGRGRGDGKGRSWARMFLFQRHFQVITVTCVQWIQNCCVYSGQIKSLFETSSPSRCLEVPNVC